MGARVYITLETAHGQSDAVLKMLRRRKGVVMADRLEGKPDVIVALEAMDRPALLALTTRTLLAVERIVDNVNIFPVRSAA